MISNNNISMNKENLIFDVSEENFAENIIERSNENLILVDFWAPWCQPCKQLTPLLEEVINEAGGVVSLAKINIDQNQQLAAQLRIQSIPTVIAFHNKKIVNAFQGSLTKDKIIEFIEKILGAPLPKNKDDFYQKIKDLFSQNRFDEAIQIIEEYLAEDSSDTKAMSLYIESLADCGRFKEIKQFLESLEENILSDNEVIKAINKYKMLESVSKEPSIEILLTNHKKDPKKIENLLKLSDKYFFEKNYEEAFAMLLNIYSNSKDKKIIKKTLLKYFETLGDSHLQTKIYRKKLSSLLFS